MLQLIHRIRRQVDNFKHTEHVASIHCVVNIKESLPIGVILCMCRYDLEYTCSNIIMSSTVYTSRRSTSGFSTIYY